MPASSDRPSNCVTILGVDPGGSITGFGVVRRDGARTWMVECGIVRSRKNDSLAQKLCRIFDSVCQQIERHKPDILAVEDVFFGKNAQSLKSMAQVRGIVILAGARAGLQIHEYSPGEVKKAVVGRGDASKEQVQRMIQNILGLAAPPEPFDAADALAVAVCHSHRLPRSW